MSSFPQGRSLNWIEIAIFGALVLAGSLLAPPGERAIVEAAILVPLSIYNSWVARGRFSYVLIGGAVVLLALALLAPTHVPSGPAPS